MGESQSEALLGEGEELEQETIADQVAVALLAKALSGDVPAARELFDSAYGKITDKVENKHSYTQTGRVIMEDGRALTFDVGSPPNEH